MSNKYESENRDSDTEGVDELNIIRNDYDAVSDIDVVG